MMLVSFVPLTINSIAVMPVINNLGISWRQKGKLEEAISHFKEALKIDPDLVPAQKNLELGLSRAGKTINPARNGQR